MGWKYVIKTQNRSEPTGIAGPEREGQWGDAKAEGASQWRDACAGGKRTSARAPPFQAWQDRAAAASARGPRLSGLRLVCHSRPGDPESRRWFETGPAAHSLGAA